MAESSARPNRHHRGRNLIPAEVLVRVPGCGGGEPPDAIERLYRSRLSASYRVRTREGEFAVRLRLAFAPGVDHSREALLHRTSAAEGLAPTLVHADAAGRFIITEYVAGAVWRANDFGKVDHIRRLGAWLRQLHSIAPPEAAPFDVLATARSYSEQILRNRPAEAQLHEQLMSRAALASRRCASGERAPTIIHNDLHHTNLIGIDELRVIDWEYAAVCDPLFDLGCVLAYYPCAALHAGALLKASGLADQVTPEMLEEAAWLSLLTSYFWHRLVRLTYKGGGDESAERELLRRLQG